MQSQSTTRDCAVCGTLFRVYPSEVDRARYCSLACRNVGLASTPKVSRRLAFICERCEMTFERFPSQARSARFCSRSCAYASRGISLIDRFWARVAKSDASSECWPWTGSLDEDGYGHIVADGRKRPAHQVAWELASDVPIPPGMQILHTCDVGACQRNDDRGTYVVNGIILMRWGHLALGTAVDNQMDKVSKQRHARGDSHGRRRK